MDNLRAQTTSSNGEISCTVDETNRIRAALGLKPLRVSKPPPPLKEGKPDQPSSDQLREKLQASRRARRRRGAAIAPRSIAEQALYEDEEEDDDVAAWVERSRQRKVGRSPVVEEQKVSVEEEKRVRGGIVASGSKSGNVADDVEIWGDETKTLTLRDADVIGVNDDVLEDEVGAGSRLRKKREEEINGMVYDGTDKKEFENVGKKGGVESVAEISKKIDGDYESEAVFRKVKKRGKKRRRRESGSVAMEGSAEALRKAADAGMMDVGESDDEEHYELLRKATAKAAERKVEGTVSRILKAVERAGKGGEEEMEEGARVVREEMREFIGLQDMDEYETDEEDRIRRAKSEEEEIEERANEGGAKRKERGEDDVKMEDLSGEYGGTSKRDRAEDVKPAIERIAEVGSETNGMTGVAATLARLRRKGELKHKPPQKGRAKDERLDFESEGHGKKEIKISYVDEFGNQLTAKEAFRELCHSFHGRGPGQNKREKRLRSMLEAAKKRSMQGDDTPLASAAALKEETQRLGSAHVVLSGAQALHLPRTEAGKANE